MKRALEEMSFDRVICTIATSKWATQQGYYQAKMVGKQQRYTVHDEELINWQRQTNWTHRVCTFVRVSAWLAPTCTAYIIEFDITNLLSHASYMSIKEKAPQRIFPPA